MDGTQIFDDWTNHGPKTYTASIPLSAGNHTVKMEYYENIGGATAKLSWALQASDRSLRWAGDWAVLCRVLRQQDPDRTRHAQGQGGRAAQPQLGSGWPRERGTRRRLLGTVDGHVQLRDGRDLHLHGDQRRWDPGLRGRCLADRERLVQPRGDHVQGGQGAERWDAHRSGRVLRERRRRGRQARLGAKAATSGPR